MKKSRFVLTIISLLLCLSCIFFGGCAKPFALSDYVSELRSDIFLGSSESYSIKAFYGYREVAVLQDGKVGETQNLLTFRLLDKETDSATYSIKFKYQDKDYSADFVTDPIAGFLTADFEIDGFNEKEFSVKISCAGEQQTVVLKSILPANTLDYKTALNKLYDTHKTLVNIYMDEEGNFNAEIYMRVIVKDDKPYYYVGFARANEKLKAILIDGLTGEVLAVREIF